MAISLKKSVTFRTARGENFYCVKFVGMVKEIKGNHLKGGLIMYDILVWQGQWCIKQSPINCHLHPVSLDDLVGTVEVMPTFNRA